MKEEIKFYGKCLVIRGNREKLLVIGDMHLGYEESLNNSGILINRHLYMEMKEEFITLLDEIGKVDKIIILGDLKHSFGNGFNQEWREVLDLLEFLKTKAKEVVVLRGNHDNYLKNISSKVGIEVKEMYLWSNFAFIHGDKEFKEIFDKKITCWIMGHAHPAIKIRDKSKVEKYKCFLSGDFKGKKVVIVPSFNPSNEGSDPREFELGLPWKFNLNNFEVLVVGEKEALNFGKLVKLG